MNEPANFTGSAPTLNPHWKEALDKAMHQSLMRGGGAKAAENDKDKGGGDRDEEGGGLGRQAKKGRKDDDDSMTLSDDVSVSEEEGEDEEEDDSGPDTPKKPGFPAAAAVFRRPPVVAPAPARMPMKEPPSVVYAAPGETADSVRARLEQNRALEREEKMELLGRLHYFQTEKGFRPFKVLGPEDTIEDIRYEVFRAQREASKRRNVKFMQKALVSLGAGIEMANSVYNPLGLRLDGFSKSLLLSIKEYDDILEELHYKYADTVSMPPELRLVMTLGSSIFFFHLSNNAPSSSSGRASSSASAPMSPPRGFSAQGGMSAQAASSSSSAPSAPAAAQAPVQRKMQGPRARGSGMMSSGMSSGDPPASRGVDMATLMNGLSMVNTLIGK